MAGSGTRMLLAAIGALALAGWHAGAGAQSEQQAAVQAMLDPSSGPAFAEGRQIYQQNCAQCHDSGVGRAPLRIVLLQLAPQTIRAVLTGGAMRLQAATLSADQKTAVAEYLTAKKLGNEPPPPPFARCTGAAARFDFAQTPAYDGIGLDPSNSHAMPDAVAGLVPEAVGKLRLKWAFAVPGATRLRSQPALAGGALTFGGSTGEVFSLDRETGCVRWSYQASSEVRTAVLVQRWRAGDTKARPLAWFGDITGNVVALDAVTGKLRWKQRVTDHPAGGISATPALYNGVLYVTTSSLEEASAADPRYPCCTFRGAVIALDAATGKTLWKHWTVPPPRPLGKLASGTDKFGPSGVAVWNSPAVDARRGQLIFATGNTYTSPTKASAAWSNAVVALDLKTGKERWHNQLTPGDVWNVGCILKAVNPNCPDDEGPDYDFGANTVVAHTAKGDMILAGQKSGVAWGLDPATGKVRWQTRVGRGGAAGGIHFGLAARDGKVFVPVNDMPDPHASGYPLSPGLYALDAATGVRLWAAPLADACEGKRRPVCLPGLGGGVSATSKLVFAGAVDGHLRIYGAADGKVLWDYDTWRDYTGLGGIPGQGGGIAGAPAPLLWHGDLFVASGYGFANRQPGNVMLAFTSR
ncbi:MAG: PQQ-binding-like beta-propeller repeat protein [Sphingomonadales bacterium]|nr:PQQ-binding-like beta-propeller repeat protein [Sphingomonadales bacterium]